MQNKIQRTVLFLFLSLSLTNIFGQSFWFGPKGGGTIAIQQWKSSERPPLFGGHVGFFVESYNDEVENPGAFYASIGLHQRGSSERSFLNSQNQLISPTKFVFNNVSLQVGIKKFFKDNYYYLVGFRGEYTAFTNLDEVNSQVVSYYYPQNEFVNRWVGGISGGAGWKYDIAELYGINVEFSIHPDFIAQYNSPEIQGVISPFTGNPVTIRANEIRNTSIELSVAMRFLRKVVYY